MQTTYEREGPGSIFVSPIKDQVRSSSMIESGVITKVTSSNMLEEVLNFLMEIIVDNRARPLFAVLFGYGLTMIYCKQTEHKDEEGGKTHHQKTVLVPRIVWGITCRGSGYSE